MNFGQVLASALVVVLGALALFATLSPPAGRHLRARAAPGAPETRIITVDEVDLAPAALDRVLRVGTWVFLFVVAAVVTVTGLWPDREPLILALLAIAAVYVFIVHELLPAGRPDRLVLMSEGVLGLLFATLLLAMTGGALSPFTPVFAMVVAGAAVVVSERAVVMAAAAACLGYLASVAIGGPSPLTVQAIAMIGVNLAIVALVAYVGVALGGEHRRAREEAVRRATEDELTGLRTRRSLFSALEREVGRSDRTGRAFCLLMIDLDDLKGINDRRGHRAGDEALRAVGAVVRARIRRIDTGARFGGDEFVVLLPETDPTGGWVLAEQIRRGIAEAGLLVDGEPVPTSASIGVVAYPQDGATVGELLERADEAMYRAKHAGRDRVAGTPDPVAGTPEPVADTRSGAPDSARAGVRDQPV
jgi:diguanylate cyclase (GGDEF)-like protein